MKNSRILIVLVVHWAHSWPGNRQVLRELLHDFRDLQEERVLLTFSQPYPFSRHFRPINFRDMDIDDFLLHFEDWSWSSRLRKSYYAMWRHEIVNELRHLHNLNAPYVVLMQIPFGDGTDYELEEFLEFTRKLGPTIIVELRIDREDRPVVGQKPEARVFQYPKERSAVLNFLRSFASEYFISEFELSQRFSMAKQKFIERNADKERPKITVAYPEVIAPNSWESMEVFLYLRDYRELVSKEIRRLQDRENTDFSSASAELPKSLPLGCPIRISLHSDSLLTNPSEFSINWYEAYNRLQFRVSPKDASKDGYSASLDIEVYADDLPVASMRLAIAVNSNAHKNRAASLESDAVWYEDVFASYAREDLQFVKLLKERYEALGVDMFIDVEDLRSGAYWQPALFQKIDNSDLFQLFWSAQSRQSKEVEIEWKHALLASRVKGGRFIRPVYWDEPKPEIPTELGAINFSRISIKRT